MAVAAGEMRREGVRLFRRMGAPGYYVRSLEEAPPWAGLFGPRNNWRRPVLKVDMKFIEALHHADLLSLEKSQPGSPTLGVARDQPLPDRYIMSQAGEAWWRRQAGCSDPFQAQHRLPGERLIDDAGRGRSLRQVNLGESPLGWLSRRKGADGTPFLSVGEVEAGERLRRDYTLAGLTQNITADWEGMLAHVDKSGSLCESRADLPIMVLDARRRVEKALTCVGPGLRDVLLATCCHLAGLEEAERSLGWPKRSAKIVLKIALVRLVAFYGLGRAGAPKQVAHVWRAPAPEKPDLDATLG